MRNGTKHIGVALILLSATLFLFRSVIVEPGGRLPVPERHDSRQASLVYQADQRAVVGMISLKAARMPFAPIEFATKSSCFPLTNPHTLGEHMFGEALLAIAPLAITKNPVATFNYVTILHLWLTGLSMYALAFFWTRSVPAALIAALLFALHPLRSTNPAHLFALANLWTPIALLAAYKMMKTGSWLATAVLAISLVLQLLESFYQVFGLALLGGVYGASLIWAHRSVLLHRIPQITLVTVVSLVFAYTLFEPYLHARETWGILQGRESTALLHPRDFLPGRDAAVGFLALILALIGLADRIRSPRTEYGGDPRLPLFWAALLVVICTVGSVPGLGVPSPIHWLREVIPGLDGIRVLRNISVGVLLVVDLLAAYGVLVVLKWLPEKMRVLGATVGVGLILVEILHPSLSRLSFGRTTSITAIEAGISEELATLYRDLPAGAVLDLPAYFGPWRKVADGPVYLMAAGFHGQPVAACYNSFSTYVQEGIEELAGQLPAPEAADALYALGFRTFALHENRGANREIRRLSEHIRGSSQLTPIGQSGDVSLFALDTKISIEEDLGQLRATRAFEYAHPLTRSRQWIPIYMRNVSTSVFRHPEPIEPRVVIVTWRDISGDIVFEDKTHAFLPLALGAGTEVGRGVEVNVPNISPGFYHIRVALESHPATALGHTKVTIQPGAAMTPG